MARVRNLVSEVAKSRLAATFALIGGLASVTFALAIVLESALQYVALAIALAASTAATALAALGLARIRIPKQPTTIGAQTSSVDSVVDAAIAVTQRRWSEPWLRPFPPYQIGRRRAVLLPGAAYHLAEIAPLADELERRGYEPIICVGEAHWSRTQPGLFWLERPTHSVPSKDQLEGVSVIVTMKDWAGYQVTIETAQGMGILTVAIVEGAQDFDDLHQPVQHRPYRTADLVLCQGVNDVAALGDRPTVVVGSNRLEQLLRAPAARPSNELALINVNFTYGVLTGERDAWVRSAVDACTTIDMPYVLSIHPAARVPDTWPNTTRLPISTLLPQASVLISRFSTVPFEAIARGIRFIYHNPHGERMPAFLTAGDAFDTTSSTAELALALRSPDPDEASQRASAEFFAHQVSVVDGATPAQRAADAIEARLEH